MKKILTYGTFDLLHYGHINYLKKAKSLGDYLIVGLSSDKFTKEKGKIPYYKFKIRKNMLESIKYVDKIIVQDSFEQKKDDIINNDIDILVSSEEYYGKYDYLKKYCKVVYLPRTKNISTTQLKKFLNL